MVKDYAMIGSLQYYATRKKGLDYEPYAAKNLSFWSLGFSIIISIILSIIALTLPTYWAMSIRPGILKFVMPNMYFQFGLWKVYSTRLPSPVIELLISSKPAKKFISIIQEAYKGMDTKDFLLWVCSVGETEMNMHMGFGCAELSDMLFSARILTAFLFMIICFNIVGFLISILVWRSYNRTKLRLVMFFFLFSTLILYLVGTMQFLLILLSAHNTRGTSLVNDITGLPHVKYLPDFGIAFLFCSGLWHFLVIIIAWKIIKKISYENDISEYYSI